MVDSAYPPRDINYCVKKLGVHTMKSYGPPPAVLHL